MQWDTGSTSAICPPSLIRYLQLHDRLYMVRPPLARCMGTVSPTPPAPRVSRLVYHTTPAPWLFLPQTVGPRSIGSPSITRAATARALHLRSSFFCSLKTTGGILYAFWELPPPAGWSLHAVATSWDD